MTTKLEELLQSKKLIEAEIKKEEKKQAELAARNSSKKDGWADLNKSVVKLKPTKRTHKSDGWKDISSPFNQRPIFIPTVWIQQKCVTCTYPLGLITGRCTNDQCPTRRVTPWYPWDNRMTLSFSGGAIGIADLAVDINSQTCNCGANTTCQCNNS